jgi:glucosyl-dolichyl phosphate glucuronosyltransferase
MDVSVIICTYNRSVSLRRTLDGFLSSQPGPGVRWELMVVDNNSSDDTKSVCESFVGRLPIRYVFEPCQGQSAARNRGIAEAAGSLLLFTDDDVDVDSGWVAAHWDAARRHPEMAFFTGKVIPRWMEPPPKWLEENSRVVLVGISMRFDRGDEEVEVTDTTWPAVGANLVFRKGVFEKTDLLFREDLGLKGNEPVRWEEIVLIRQMMAKGFRGLYVPGAFVHHRNGSERTTEHYVRKWFKGWGMTDIRLGQVDLTTRHWLFGVPRWWWRKMLENVISYGVARLTQPPQVWLERECRMARRWGRICELRAQGKRGTRRSPQTEPTGLPF